MPVKAKSHIWNSRHLRDWSETGDPEKKILECAMSSSHLPLPGQGHGEMGRARRKS